VCGIAGLIALDPQVAIDRQLLDRMVESLAHRGPDGSGTWSGEGAGLGHRRLAIVDLQGGAQPWVNEQNTAVLVYNGELYNHLELRKQLENTFGIRFHSRCDTEVVFHSLLHWGIESALQRFRGMFALALWETLPRRLTLARDPLGIKPLYWSMRGGLLRFGSEIKAILCDTSFPHSPDLTSLVNYLAHYRLSFRGKTLFKYIQEVMPGSYIQWKEKRRAEVVYWRLPLIPESEKRDLGEETTAEEFRIRLLEAVKRRLMADVPVGAYLSGGIDSTVIVSLMKNLGHKNLKTFSIGFEEEGYNEFSYSTLVAAKLKVPHRKVALREAGYFREFEDLIRIKDTPLSVPNEVPLRFLSRVLKKNIKVVLSGEGADELLGGYSYLVRSPHDYLIGKAVEDDHSALNSTDRERLRNSLIAMYGEAAFKSQKLQFLRLYNWMPQHERESLFREAQSYHDAEKEIAGYWDETWAELDQAHLDPYEKILYILENIHLSALLLRLDATTMAESVEGRVPFTDRDLVEWVCAQPVHYKVRWRGKLENEQAQRMTALEVHDKLDITKYLLRLAYAGSIPDQILMRPKYAFPVPLDRWFFGAWHEWARQRILTPLMGELFNLKQLEHFLVTARGKDEGMKIWMLANLGIWLQLYFGK